MSKIARKPSILFGRDGTTDNFAQFGSVVGPGVNNTKDPSVIQALTAWVDGWQDAIFAGDKAPVLQEMNALCLVFSYLMSYLYQEGIPEWDSSTTYFIGSIVQKTGTSPVELYESLVDNNTNQALPSAADNANWRFMNPQPNGTPGFLSKFATSRTFADSVIRESAGAIGIGAAPASGSILTVNGRVESLSGGYKFPDGSVQTTAGVAATAGLFVQRQYNENANHPALAAFPSFVSSPDNIPQITDGVQVLSMTFTPKSSSSKLRVRALCHVGGYGPGIGWALAAVFINGGANAIGAAAGKPPSPGPAYSDPYWISPVVVEFELAPASLAPIAFTVRAGSQSAGSFLNSMDTNRRLGGLFKSFLEVVEILN